ncbi:hypothetical protein ACFL2B_01140 [Patescibacteria group bacterium]
MKVEIPETELSREILVRCIALVILGGICIFVYLADRPPQVQGDEPLTAHDLGTIRIDGEISRGDLLATESEKPSEFVWHSGHTFMALIVLGLLIAILNKILDRMRLV